MCVKSKLFPHCCYFSTSSAVFPPFILMRRLVCVNYRQSLLSAAVHASLMSALPNAAWAARYGPPVSAPSRGSDPTGWTLVVLWMFGSLIFICCWLKRTSLNLTSDLRSFVGASTLVSFNIYQTFGFISTLHLWSCLVVSENIHALAPR